MFHEGPAAVYMARAGEGVTLEEWRGDDGAWVKVGEVLESKERKKEWGAWMKSSVSWLFHNIILSLVFRGLFWFINCSAFEFLDGLE